MLPDRWSNGGALNAINTEARCTACAKLLWTFQLATRHSMLKTKEKSSGLCGAKLAKMLSESIINTRIRRMSEIGTMQGNFETEEDLDKMMKDKPNQLEALKQNAPRVTCQYTGEELILKPVYNFKRTQEEVNQDKEEFDLESKKSIKKLKTEPEEEEKKARQRGRR